MNLKNGKVFTSKFVGTGPSSYEKRIYRTVVSQRLRNTELDALISQIYFWNKTLHVSDSSSVHHQEFFTVHKAVYTGLLTVCSQAVSKPV